MEYHSCRIHLHRPMANFGSSPYASGQHRISRQLCIESAESIAVAIAHYRHAYGTASTMSGIGLHIIATAITILIADLAEKRQRPSSLAPDAAGRINAGPQPQSQSQPQPQYQSGPQMQLQKQQMRDLQTCIRGLCELEKTYVVARRVRRIIRLILGVCHVDIGVIGAPSGAGTGTGTGTAGTSSTAAASAAPAVDSPGLPSAVQFPSASLPLPRMGATATTAATAATPTGGDPSDALDLFACGKELDGHGGQDGQDGQDGHSSLDGMGGLDHHYMDEATFARMAMAGASGLWAGDLAAAAGYRDYDIMYNVGQFL